MPVETTEQREILQEEDQKLGITQELNRQILHPMGLSIARKPDGSLGLFDCRSVAEVGLVYGEFTAENHEAAGIFRRLRGELLLERKRQLGYTQQPIERSGPTENPHGPWGDGSGGA